MRHTRKHYDLNLSGTFFQELNIPEPNANLKVKSALQKQILKKLIGKTNHIATLPSGKKSPELTFYYVTNSIIEDDGNVKEFVIKQIKINFFEIDYVSETAITLEQIKKIEMAIELYLKPDLHFQFTHKKQLQRSSRGKLQQFKSML